jgi:hypothetical protein
MKKIMIGFLLLFTIATKVSAQEGETQGIKYWYYPAQNVYYNDADGNYWYYSSPTQTWVTVKELPATYVLAPTDERYAVYYNGTDVWKMNKQHKTKYKVKKNGTVKNKGEKNNQ